MITFDCTSYSGPPKLYMKSQNEEEFTALGDVKYLDIGITEPAWDNNAVVRLSMDDESIKNTYPEDMLNDTSSFDHKMQGRLDETERLRKVLDEYTKNEALNKSMQSVLYKIICTSIKKQNRTHHKYRINKKWAKRYGYTYHETQTEPIILIDHTVYVTHDAFEIMKRNMKIYKSPYICY